MSAMLRSVAGLLCWLLVSSACAQFSGSVGLVSDYRFRGISLSDSKPALQATVGYDGDSGWYVGAFASTVRFEDTARPAAQVMVYAGRAGRLTERLSWDAGIDDSSFPSQHDYDYPEAYAGLTLDSLSLRLHHAHSYFGEGGDANYLELNGAWPLDGRLRFVAHLGNLWTSGVPGGNDCCGLDARMGVSFAAAGLRWEIAGVATSVHYPTYPSREGQSRGTLIVGVTRSF
jgi:uncharacterized protein (TIGR02001 family)